jgi:hypothetical protein
MSDSARVHRFKFSRMMKKSKRQTFFLIFVANHPLKKQGVKFDSLLARGPSRASGLHYQAMSSSNGCRQGVKALFQHPVI